MVRKTPICSKKPRPEGPWLEGLFQQAQETLTVLGSFDTEEVADGSAHIGKRLTQAQVDPRNTLAVDQQYIFLGQHGQQACCKCA